MNLPALQFNQHGASFRTEDKQQNCFFIPLVFNFMQFPSNWFFWVHVQGVAHNPVLLIENIDPRIFYDMQYVTQETALKLIKIKKITSKSDRLLHLNMPVNNFHFWVHELSISLKTYVSGEVPWVVTCPEGEP